MGKPYIFMKVEAKSVQVFLDMAVGLHSNPMISHHGPVLQ